MPSLGRMGVVSAFWLLPLTAAAAQPSLTISHDALECWPSDQHPIVSGSLVPAGEVRNARVYFRSEAYPDFYYVDAELLPDGRIEAVLPLAAPGTDRVIYYIEALSIAFESSRTPEWTPEVAESDECRRRDPLLALFQGDVPEILLGAVRSGAPLIPPGFQAAGIVAATAGGAGVSAAAVGAIVAGGAAGGVVVATAGGETTSVTTTPATTSEHTTTVASGGTTTVLSTTTASATTTVVSTTTSAFSTTTVPVSTTTTTSSPTTTSPATTTVGASTTTTAVSTTTTAGSTTVPVSTTTSVAGSSTTTTTAPSSSTTTGRPAADLSVSISAPGTIGLGNLLRYQVTVRNAGPSRATSVRLTISLPLGVTLNSIPGVCSGLLGSVECFFPTISENAAETVDVTVLALQLGSVTASASVSATETDPNPGNNSDSVTTDVTLLSKVPTASSLRLAAALDVPPANGRDRAEVQLGPALFGVDDTAPIEIPASAAQGEHTIEAVLVAASGRKGQFRFELRLEGDLEISALTPESGSVVAIEPRAVTFAIRGEAGERVRFRYRVAKR